jgi:hypothetical protein
MILITTTINSLPSSAEVKNGGVISSAPHTASLRGCSIIYRTVIIYGVRFPLRLEIPNQLDS